jgi:hypothetical protein
MTTHARFLWRHRLGTMISAAPAILVLGVCATAAAQPAKFVLSGNYYRYGFFGRGATVDSFGPELDGYGASFSFPDSTATRFINSSIGFSSGGGILGFGVSNESFLRARIIDGNDWGGGFDVFVDVYVEGPTNTAYYIERSHDGQATATHGSGLGTTHASVMGLTAVVNNGSGTDQVFVNLNEDKNFAGVTGAAAHPADPNYHFAGTYSYTLWDFTFQSLNFCFTCPLFNYEGTSTLTGSLAAGPCCPTDPKLPDWNTDPGTQYTNNCYNYATNKQTNSFAQPGGFLPPGDITCDTVSAGATADGFEPITHGDPDSCGPGDCVVALVIQPGPPANPVQDFHWYRRNSDGSWSHKPGQTRATRNDASGNPITDPQTADRGGYTIFCGYYCVPCTFEIIPPLPAPDNDQRGSGLTVSLGITSGLTSPTWSELDAGVIDMIRSMIAGATPTDPPEDTGMFGYSGFVVRPDAGVADFPTLVRVFNGVLWVHDKGTTSFFTDTLDLEGLLIDQADSQGYGRLIDGSCLADITEPFGQVDFFDLQLYLNLFSAMNPRADLRPPYETFDFFDIQAYLNLYSEGCP